MATIDDHDHRAQQRTTPRWMVWALRAALLVYVAVILAVMAVYFSVANMDVPRSAYVLGPTSLVAGQTQAFRAQIYNARSGLPLRDVQVQLSLSSPAKDTEDESVEQLLELARAEKVVGKATVAPTGYIHGEVKAPGDAKPGVYSLILHAEQTIQHESWAWRVPIEVKPPPKERFWPEAISRLTRAEREKGASAGSPESEHPTLYPVVWESQGDVRVDVMPANGELKRGLPNQVVLRACDRKTGEPKKLRLAFVVQQGMVHGEMPPQVIETDEAGLAMLELKPVGNLLWELRALREGEAVPQLNVEEVKLGADLGGEGEAKEESKEGGDEAQAKEDAPWGVGKFYLKTVASQFSVRPRKRIWGPGETIEAYTFSLFRDEGFLVDLWADEAWVSAAAFGLSKTGGGIRLRLAPKLAEPRLGRLQVYRDLYEVGQAWDTTTVVLWPSDVEANNAEGLEGALRWLVARHASSAPSEDICFAGLAAKWDREGLATVSSSKKRQWLEALAVAVPGEFATAKLWLNSQRGDRARLKRWKSEISQDLLFLVVLILLVGASALSLVVVSGVAQSQAQRRMVEAVELELHDGEGALGVLGKAQRAMVVLQGAVILGTLLMFAIGLVILLSYL